MSVGSKLVQLVVASLVFAAAQSHAALITWSGASLNASNASSINTSGALVEAHNTGLDAGSVTVGSVTFDNTETNPFGSVFSGSNASSLTGSVGLDKILNTASFFSPNDGGSYPFNFTIDGLSTGAGYLIQFFVADTRTTPSPRTVIVSDGTNSLESGQIGQGYAFTGEFTADASSQLVEFSGTDPRQDNAGAAYINAWQLRQTSTSDVPAPGTMLLVGLGLAGFGYSRRKSA